MKLWAGAIVDAVAILAATWALNRGLISGPMWGMAVVPIVAYWLRARMHPGNTPGGGAALFVVVGLLSATLGLRNSA